MAEIPSVFHQEARTGGARLDEAAAIQRVKEFQLLLDQSRAIHDRNVARGMLDARDPEYTALDAQINQRRFAIEKFAEAIDPAIASRIKSRAPYLWPYRLCREATDELLGALQDIEMRAEVLGPTAARLDPTALHPWAWEPAAELWANEYYAEAVRSASSRIFDTELPKKVGVPGYKIAEAFSKEAPSQGKPRLRFSVFREGTENWTNAHDAAKFLGMGCEKGGGIRNLVTHGGRAPDKETALEMLAALSLIAALG